MSTATICASSVLREVSNRIHDGVIGRFAVADGRDVVPVSIPDIERLATEHDMLLELERVTRGGHLGLEQQELLMKLDAIRRVPR